MQFWTVDEAVQVYAVGAGLLQCADPANYAAALPTLLACLQSKTAEEIAGTGGSVIAVMDGVPVVLADMWKKFAKDDGSITQMEIPFGPVKDGSTILDDPRTLMAAGSSRPDTPYLYENGREEASSMIQMVFTDPATLIPVFGQETYEALWLNNPSGALVPYKAHMGFLQTIYAAAPESLLNALLAENALGCAYNANDPTGPYQLFNDCKKHTVDWMTSWMWSCNARQYLTGLASQFSGEGSSAEIYAFELTTGYPGADYGQDGHFLPHFESGPACYNAGEGLSCHIVGQAYLFGETELQEEHGTLSPEMTDEESDFAVRYRGYYAEFIKTGQISDIDAFNTSGNKFTQVNLDGNVPAYEPFPNVCYLFDMMNSYMAIR